MNGQWRLRRRERERDEREREKREERERERRGDMPVCDMPHTGRRGVHLGLPGDVLVLEEEEEETGKDVYVDVLFKVGGHALVPTHVKDEDRTRVRVTCVRCTKRMSLVVQAPTQQGERGEGGDRCLYVFVCTRTTCELCWKYWKAIRIQTQKINENEQEGKEQEEKQENDDGKQGGGGGGGASYEEVENATRIETGKDEDWWNDTSWNDNKDKNSMTCCEQGEGDGDVDAGNIVKALQQTSLTPLSSQKNSKKKKKRERRERRGLSWKQVSCPHALPSFCLHMTQEPQHGARASKLDLRVKQLVEEYKEEMKGRGVHEGKGAGDAAAAVDSEKGKQTQVGWTNEQYEDLEADEKQFRKFLERVNWEPSQCIRFSSGGNLPLLWPSKESPLVPACQYCGSPRKPELQIMSPTISYINESIQWELDAGRTYDADAESADFVTVGVFTCSASCSQGNNAVFVEECRAKAEELGIEGKQNK